MEHAIEPATSGRARCRGCGRAIRKGEPRLGERIPNPFADEGDSTLWFHPACGAYKRPEPFLAALATTELEVPHADRLRAAAELGAAHRRVPRIDGAERAPTSRASCRACREKIAKGAWRVRLVFYDEGRFEPSGSIHLECAQEYFETPEIADRVLHFTGELDGADRAELERALG
jgi:hypothetical protein